MGLRRCSSGGRGGGLGERVRQKAVEDHVDELRSALALSAPGADPKTHLKEVRENKKVEEQLKEEKIPQQTLKKLHGLQRLAQEALSEE